MNCPACSNSLGLLYVEEEGDVSTVYRECLGCGKRWALTYESGKKEPSKITEIEEGVEFTGNTGFGYTCAKCQYESFVCTVFQPTFGWNCINCGEPIPRANMRPFGGYELLPERERPIRPGKTRTPRGERRRREPGYQREPRTSRPIPEGAISVKEVAEKIGIEPKKLRSWLRKVHWRKEEEARSAWYFSPSEVEEVMAKFGK